MIKKLSVIIPVFNEEKTIEAVLERVLSQKIGDWEKEIIVVDDGSTDDTEKKINNFAQKISILKNKNNLGKGAALIAGFKFSTGEAIIVQDADLEYSPTDWPMMLEALEDNPDVVAIYGSRELGSKRDGYFCYIWGARSMTFLVNLFFNSKLTDVYTCYKLFRADFLKKLEIKSNGFEADAEITCKTLKNNGKIKELAINYCPRKFERGKHIRAKDGLIGAKTILECWLAKK